LLARGIQAAMYEKLSSFILPIRNPNSAFRIQTHERGTTATDEGSRAPLHL